MSPLTHRFVFGESTWFHVWHVWLLEKQIISVSDDHNLTINKFIVLIERSWQISETAKMKLLRRVCCHHQFTHKERKKQIRCTFAAELINIPRVQCSSEFISRDR